MLFNYLWMNIPWLSSNNHKLISEFYLAGHPKVKNFLRISKGLVLLIISLRNWSHWKSNISQKCLVYLLLCQDPGKILGDTLCRDGLQQEMKRSEPNGWKSLPVIWHLNVQLEPVTSVYSQHLWKPSLLRTQRQTLLSIFWARISTSTTGLWAWWFFWPKEIKNSSWSLLCSFITTYSTSCIPA